MKQVILISLSITLITSLISCGKEEGLGGEAEIAATVKHHEAIIPHATVYIKYGAKEFPGTDTTLYDASKVTGTIDHPHTHFKELQKGDYFLYAVGYDSVAALPVKGGLYVELGHHDHKEVVIQVNE